MTHPDAATTRALLASLGFLLLLLGSAIVGVFLWMGEATARVLPGRRRA